MSILGGRLNIKDEIRVVGFDDGPVVHGRDSSCLVVGVILRGHEYLDGVISARVAVDGLDSTEKIASAVLNSRHFDQIRVIFLDGLAFAGFNLVDIHELARITKKVVIAVTATEPDRDAFVLAASKLPDGDKRVEIIERAGEVNSIEINGKWIYFQFAGSSLDDVRLILTKSAYRAALPEAIRMSHLIAGGVVNGDSRGRA